MPWPILAPATIASNAAGIYEASFPGCDARSANTVFAVTTRIIALTSYDLRLYAGYLSQELMPDTAVDWLPRHASIWGVPQEQPVAATGNLIFSGAALTQIPAGTTLTYQPTGALYLTLATVTIPAGSNSVSAAVTAATPGVAGNLAAGTMLQLVSPIGGLTAQSGTADASGIANGTDLESVVSWRARILQRIRQAPAGGATQDYTDWAEAAGAPYVNVVGGWVGAGSVGVIIAGPGPSVASPQLVAAVQAYINDPTRRPVTARVVVAAAVLQPVNATVHLVADNTTTRAAAAAAFALFFQRVTQIGATVYANQIENAIAAASGSPALDLIAPTADVVVGNNVMPVAGVLSFQ